MEKTLGQLCDRSATDIVSMLQKECTAAGVTIRLNTTIDAVTHNHDFHLQTGSGVFTSRSLVIATGGLSIPKIGRHRVWL